LLVNSLQSGKNTHSKQRKATPRGVRKGGLGLTPLWSWHFTKTLVHVQRRSIAFAYFLLVHMST